MTLSARVVAFASRGVGASAGAPVVDGGLLPSRLRRGTSVATRLVADLVRDVAPYADLAAARFVLGSAWGEIETAYALLGMRHAHDGALSPARFTLSVHSAPLSVLGIALGAKAPSTAIAAGPLTFAMALLEGLAACAETDSPVVVLVADETPPEALRAGSPAAAGVALVLARGQEGGAPIRLVREARAHGGELAAIAPGSAPQAAAALLDALRTGSAGRVAVGEDEGAHYVVHVGADGRVAIGGAHE